MSKTINRISDDIVIEARDTVERIFSDDTQIGVLTSLINKAIDLAVNSKEDMENIHELGQGWIAEEALAIAIYCSNMGHIVQYAQNKTGCKKQPVPCSS